MVKRVGRYVVFILIALYVTVVPSRGLADPILCDLYVTFPDDDQIAIVDTFTGSVTDTIAVGDGPAGVTFSPNGAYAYVSNNYAGTISVINTASKTVETTINVNPNPDGVSVSPDGSLLYVGTWNAQGNSDVIQSVSTATNTLEASITSNSNPTESVFSPDGTRAYVSNWSTASVSVIDVANNTELTEISVGQGPDGIAITPDGSTVYVTTWFNKVSVIDTASNAETTTINVGMTPIDIVLSSDGSTAYVTNSGFNNNTGAVGSTVSVINTATNAITTTIATGVTPVGVAITPDDGTVYVANNDNASITVIDTTTTNTTSITLVGNGFGLAIKPGCASPPDAPQNVTATAGDSSAVITWDPPASDGGESITSYTVTASNNAGTCTTNGSLTCEMQNLVNGTSYTFTITATNAIGEGPASNASQAIVPQEAPAPTPTPTPTPIPELDPEIPGYTG